MNFFNKKPKKKIRFENDDSLNEVFEMPYEEGEHEYRIPNYIKHPDDRRSLLFQKQLGMYDVTKPIVKPPEIETLNQNTKANEIVPEHLKNRFYLKPENKNVRTKKIADPNNPHKRLDEYMSVKNSNGRFDILTIERPHLGGYTKSKKINQKKQLRKSNKSRKSRKSNKSRKSRKTRKSRKNKN
jgi:hypothetical protein